ncbi:Vancomycin aglycone glucosyltransferase [Cytospora mali]|uniref:Vancomycin aglycone glucosyltransferase n=1 Tax=Cytospora mali TaxID=578113 RepID=A0A194VST2_CYTMA|nr:Vancomycin aglycone glucosyltransferase [Valsa mali]
MAKTIAGAALDKSSRLRKVNDARGACGLHGPPPVINASKLASRIICPSLPELDFPMRVRPTTFGCGPIALPKRLLGELDPQMDMWLRRKGMKTILVNLGTHHTMDSTLSLEIARTLKQILDKVSDLQVLWKIMLRGDGQQEHIVKVFGPELFTQKRIRLERWLKADPVALLDTGKVIAQVHHGGANTYFECCQSGVPQVILASWWDTYEYAARVEYLGVGVFANKKAAPRAQNDEFREALLEVIGNPEMSAKARELASVCQRNGEGRVRARDLIVDILHTQASTVHDNFLEAGAAEQG